MGLVAQGIALFALRADVQKAHPGLFHTHDPPSVKAPQKRELQQIFRCAFCVGSGVAQHGPTAQHRDLRAQRRPANAPDALHHQRSPREQRAGGAGGYHRLRPALLDGQRALDH
ncbi:hypothetical protein SDC9_184363 [bioreactor metagenome]|uniref:Uncharacterized protein n=1 Tax=bioreactor metagenome TaxID=1076179 RepID=A0A645HCU5_9ZZZZ